MPTSLPRLVLPLVLAVTVLAVAGCDALGGGDYEEEIVVSAVLIADAPLPAIALTRTAPVGDFYDPASRRVRDAEVAISLLAPDGGVEATYPYGVRDDGFYWQLDSIRVLPGRRYRFEAVVPGFPTITAETTVPTAFTVVRPPADTLVYQVDEPPTVDVTVSVSPGRQAVFVFTTRALEPENYPLTPFAAELVAEREVDPADLVTGTSPLLNEGNYDANPDGTISIRVPWLAINYYGPYRFFATALDDALVQFLETQAIQFIPTTLSPGEIPNVTTNVVNGLGVFGSAAQVSSESFIAQED